MEKEFFISLYTFLEFSIFPWPLSRSCSNCFQLRTSRLSLEECGIVAFHIRKREQSFTKMLISIFSRLLHQADKIKPKPLFYSSATSSVRFPHAYLVSMTRPTSSSQQTWFQPGLSFSFICWQWLRLLQIHYSMLPRTATIGGKMLQVKHFTRFCWLLPIIFDNPKIQVQVELRVIFKLTFSNHQ